MNKEKDTAIRMIYSSMAKIRTSKGTEILHQTINVSKPYELPQGMDIEQACRVISYLSDKVESQNSYKPASEESVNGVLCQLERYGFIRRGHYPYGHIESSTFIRKDQAIELCNIIAEEILIDKFDDNIGTYKIENSIVAGKGDNIPDAHLIAYRLFKEEIMYNWIKYIELLINNHFAYSGVMYNRDNLLQQKFSETLWDNIRTFINNFANLPIWRDRSMSATIFGGKNNYEFWKTVFETGKTPDGISVLLKPINVTEMIKK